MLSKERRAFVAEVLRDTAHELSISDPNVGIFADYEAADYIRALAAMVESDSPPVTADRESP